MGGVGGGGRPDPKRRRLPLKLRAQGLTLKQIGERLGMSREGARQLLIATGQYRPLGRTAGKRSDAMNQTDFAAALEQELQLGDVTFTRADVLDFVASVWPLVQEDPDITFWAREFIEAD